MPAKKIAILGSCVTRDPFALPRGQHYRIPTYVARTSLISLAAPPIAIADGSIVGPHQFDIQCLQHDFQKTALDTILANGLDYLILDFVDERFDLVKIQDSVVVDTRYAKDYGVIANNNLTVDGNILRTHPSTSDLWASSCRTVIDRILKFVSPEQIILHSCRLASHYQSDGVIKPFIGYYAGLTSTFNPIFADYEAFFLSAMPDCRIIKVADDLVIGDEQHRWKLQPFHYVPGYYEAFLNQLDAITSGRSPSP